MVKDERYYSMKKRRLILTGLIIFIAFFVFLPFLTYYYFAPDLSSKEKLMNKKDSGVVLLDRDGQPFFSFYEGKIKSYTPLSDISPLMQEAAISVEDKEFY